MKLFKFYYEKKRRIMFFDEEGEYVETIEMSWCEAKKYCMKNDYVYQTVTKQLYGG